MYILYSQVSFLFVIYRCAIDVQQLLIKWFFKLEGVCLKLFFRYLTFDAIRFALGMNGNFNLMGFWKRIYIFIYFKDAMYFFL